MFDRPSYSWLVALLLSVLLSPLLVGCSGVSPADETTDDALIDGLRPISEADIGWLFEPQEIPGFSQEAIGVGPEAAILLKADDAPSPNRVVVLLHRWGAVPPSLERQLVEVLAEVADLIVYPVYQEGATPVEDYLPNAVAGVDAALGSLKRAPESIVFVGLITGGALAFDLASVAAAQGLPQADSAIAVFPGRSPKGTMPRPDYGSIPAGTRLMTVDGPDNRIPRGSREARRMLRLATAVSDAQKRLHHWAGASRLADASMDEALTIRWRPILKFIRGSQTAEAGS